MTYNGLPEQGSGLGRRPTRQDTRPSQRSNREIAQQQTLADVDEEGDDDIYEDSYPPRMPSSTRRYSVNNDVLAKRGVEVQHHYYDQPLAQGYRQPPVARRSRIALPAPQQQHGSVYPHPQAVPPRRYIYEEAPEQPVTQKRKIHWLLFVGIAMIVMLAGWFALSALGTWWQTHQDDATYGNPRTYQTDAVVGHADSSTSPTHFIGVNLNGNIIVIELPGGNAAKARSYTITSIPGNSGNPPVKLVFQDINRDGKLDLIVQIGDPGQVVTIMLFNNGAQFVSKL